MNSDKTFPLVVQKNDNLHLPLTVHSKRAHRGQEIEIHPDNYLVVANSRRINFSVYTHYVTLHFTQYIYWSSFF